jgi:hypothetical protein
MIVWVDMLPEDSAAEVGTFTEAISDPRIRWFHDPKHRASQAIAAVLGAKGKLAWDVYLFFDVDAEWGATPPRPRGWVHQLGDSWADPARRRHGDELEPELARLLNDVLRG